MAPRKIYAERTSVPITQSRGAIENMLRKEGATRILTMDDALEAIVMFMLSGRLIKLSINVPGDADQQRRKAIWRAILLVVRAKVEAVGQGITTVEQEWLAHVVLPDGKTVGEWIEPQLQVAYDRGTMPSNPLLLEGPRS